MNDVGYLPAGGTTVPFRKNKKSPSQKGQLLDRMDWTTSCLFYLDRCCGYHFDGSRFAGR